MSYSNGTTNGAASLSELQEQLKAARIKRALLRTQAETSVLESYVGLSQYSAQWGQPIDPLDAVRDPLTGMLWRPVGSEKRHEPDANGLNNAREIGRLLLESNALAIGLMEHLVSFVVGEGMTYKVAADKGQRPPADLLLSVQDIVDEFVETNVWNEFEQELVRRSRRDGEYLLREFPVDGVLHVRTIEPEYVCPPDGAEAEQYPLGIKTADGDDQTPVAFWVRCGSDEPGESIPADQVHHCKVNVDRAVLRGVSDFFPVADDLEGTRKLLRNMREGGAVQAAIAWIEQFDGATASSLTSQINAKRDLNRPYPNDPITGRQVNMQKLEPGTVVKVGGNRRYEPAPLAANTTQHIAIVQACLRAALTRWGMPEYLSGDASNANYASTLVAGAPFVRIVKRLQAFYKRRFLAVVKRAVQVAVEAGRLPGYTWGQVNRLVDIQAEPPDPVIADAAQQTQVRNIEHQAGVLSLRTWRAKAGYDDETETQNLQAEAAQQQAQQPQQPEPGGDTGNQGGGLASLFGESADPLARRLAQLREQYGEGLAGEIAEAASRLLGGGDTPLLEGGFTGIVTAKNGAKYHYVNGKRVSKKSYEDHGGKPDAGDQQPPAKAPTKKQATKQESAKAVALAMADPGKLSADDLSALGGHLQNLTVPEITALQQKLGAKGGKVKADKVQAVVAALKAAGQPKPAPAPAAPPTAPAAAPADKKAAKKLDSKGIVDAALADPGSLSKAELQQLHGHLSNLPVGELKAIQAKLGVTSKGPTKNSKVNSIYLAVEKLAYSATPDVLPPAAAAPLPKVSGTGKGGKVSKQDKPQVEELVKSQVAAYGGDAFKLADSNKAINGIAKSISEATDGTVGYWEVQYALQNLATQETNKLLPPQFAKGGAQNKPNASLPNESRPKLTLPEAVAVQKYTGTAFRDLNKSLRETGKPPAQFDELHQGLQSAFQKAKPFTTPVTVHRGMNLQGAELADFLGKVQEAQASGGTITHPGYVSTSSQPISAFQGNIKLQIQAKHGLDLKPYTHYPHESEVLLNHGAQFRVVSLSKVGGTHKIVLEQV